MNVVSLFSGCGGLDCGFEKAGFKVIWANECDSKILATYKLNHPNTVLNSSDIRDLLISDIPDCDGIIGGPPCQSWSLGGRCLGIQDDRGKLVYDYIRIVKGKKPRFFIMENVSGMVSERHIRTFLTFLKNFQEIGYNVKYELLNAVDYKVPQDRLRVFVVGIRNDIENTYLFPPPQTDTHITLLKAIGDLKDTPIPYLNESVNNNYDAIPNHDYYIGAFDKKFMARNRVRTWEEVSYTIQAQAKNEPLHPQAPKMIFVSENERKFKKGYEMLYRRLSVRECARIQSFPDTFRFVYTDVKDGYKMVGNAVPPRMAFFLAKSIKDCLETVDNGTSYALVGYVKNNKVLNVIRAQKVYYVRGGNQTGALTFSQLDHSIRWLLLHNGNERYYFELNNVFATSCNKQYLRSLGFSPQGETYWLFNIKRELTKDEIDPKLHTIVKTYTKKPQIISF